MHYLPEAADYLGQGSVKKQRQHADAGQSCFNLAATFILAGQIGQEPHGAYLSGRQLNHYLGANPLSANR
ncbi:MAG: hypothetical protein LUQ11_08585 [Methylococcaceae bacterium]|nr:hypothetical protein [Methylococcaceae bacterium]